MKPPSVRNVTNIPLTANTASAAIPTGVDGATDRSIVVVCSRTFDIIFSDDGTATIANPAGTGIFLAGVLYPFDLGPRNTHFKAIASAAGTLKWWRASRT